MYLLFKIYMELGGEREIEVLKNAFFMGERCGRIDYRLGILDLWKNGIWN